MADKILAKSEFIEFLEGLQKTYDVFCPKLGKKGYFWDLLTNSKDISWDFLNTAMSPKEFFFPQTECLMHFENDEDSKQGMYMQPEPMISKKKILLNIRPCDAKAFSILDTIFCQDEITNDVYWRNKREKTLLIGLACNKPGSNCFCVEMNCGPHDIGGLDVLLVDLGEDLLIRSMTERGEVFFEQFSNAKKNYLEKALFLENKAKENLTKNELNVSAVVKKDLLKLFENSFWEDLSKFCLNCAVCTFCCPTCHCFDIQDEVQGNYGRRVRNWDYCMSWLFTIHGSGHNPRQDKKSRFRQRFMHKFSYIPAKKGSLGCVGCGRCVKLCPVNVDIREVLKMISGV